MSLISHLEKIKLPVHPEFPKLTTIQRQYKKSLTEQAETLYHQNQNNICLNNILYPLMERAKEDSWVTIKYKKSQYCGYKQNSTNKGRNLKIHQQQQRNNQKQLPKISKINSLNIAKIRKRLSLQPISFVDLDNQSQKKFLSTSKSLRKGSQQIQSFDTSRSYHKQLRLMVRLMDTQKKNLAKKMSANEEKNTDDSDQLSQNLSPTHQFITEQNQDDIDMRDERLSKTKVGQKKTQCHNKPYYIQLKKRVKDKVQNNKKRKDNEVKINALTTEEQFNLCGWQSQSFYPKIKSNCYQKSPFQRMKLLKGEI